MGKSKKNRAASQNQTQHKARLQPKHSASAIPFQFWIAANYWTMWNAYRQIAGMSRQ